MAGGDPREQDALVADRPIPRPVTMPWGKGKVVEEVSINDKYKEAVVQLIEWDEGGLTVRFCQYWPDGRFQRQPLMVAVEDLPALGRAIRQNDRLHATLRRLLDEA